MIATQSFWTRDMEIPESVQSPPMNIIHDNYVVYGPLLVRSGINNASNPRNRDCRLSEDHLKNSCLGCIIREITLWHAQHNKLGDRVMTDFIGTVSGKAFF